MMMQQTESGTAVLVRPMKRTNLCVAMRGRNPDNPSDRRGGIELEQRLELQGMDGLVCGTLTTLTKDNMILEVDEYDC